MAELYGDWDSLVTAVESRIPVILETDVAPVAERILKQHIKSDIYGVYTPKAGGWFGNRLYNTPYQRRGNLAESVFSEIGVDGDGYQLLITSDESANTPVSPNHSWSNRGHGSFLQLIEEGSWGLWKSGFPRPAVFNAQKDINSSTSIQSAIKKGIKREIG